PFHHTRLARPFPSPGLRFLNHVRMAIGHLATLVSSIYFFRAFPYLDLATSGSNFWYTESRNLTFMFLEFPRATYGATYESGLFVAKLREYMYSLRAF